MNQQDGFYWLGWFMGLAYFLPIIIMIWKGRLSLSVVLINICFGWTLIGWFLALFIAESLSTNALFARKTQKSEITLHVVNGTPAPLDEVQINAAIERIAQAGRENVAR